MKAKFQSKGLSYILKFSLEDFARIAEPNSPNADFDEEMEKVRDSIDKINLNESKKGSSSHKKQVLNIEKKKEYMRDEGTLKFILLQGPEDDDQALLDEYVTSIKLWRYLQSKYRKPSKLAAEQYPKDLNDFEFTPGLTIRDAWNKLKDLRRKIVVTNLLL
ncbi:hypothetical protein EV44_g5480 [Erysiphe necator]|uniref:Uncharacterized protein n=1 Tax=Uncinula necator TaxID=52586 RepID=A0A0B1P031_UNCNE|nr:hypothetical protein EV44_g5480 [Erysiphe necator]